MSAINEERKTIFIHIPKTAGTSMEDSGHLGTVVTRHYGMDHYAENFDISKYFKFAFVRNPYDRLKSGICNHPLKGTKITPESFNKFILAHKDMLTKWIATKPQHTFVCLNGKLAMDFVGKFEEIRRDWERICDKLGMSFKLDHDKKSSYPKEDLYSDEVRELVKRIYKKDFELFNYE